MILYRLTMHAHELCQRLLRSRLRVEKFRSVQTEVDEGMMKTKIRIDLEILEVIDQVEEFGSHQGRLEAAVTEVETEVQGDDHRGHLEVVMEVVVDEALGLPRQKIG